MPFLRLPSLYGFVAVLIFVIMTYKSVQDSNTTEAALWAITAVAYFLRNIPKFFMFGFINVFAFLLLVVGTIGLVLVYTDII